MKLIPKEQALKELGISKNVFEYRCKELDLTPIVRGKYSRVQINRINRFNKIQKTKRRKTPKVINNTIHAFEFIKVTEIYHIYESKMNNYGK